MRLERDNIPLDKEFPFQISEVELTPENSRPGSYHWHSYFEITCVLGGKGNYFVNGQELVMAGCPEEMQELIGYYLAHDSEREKIARKGKEKTLKQFDYHILLRKMIEESE